MGRHGPQHSQRRQGMRVEPARIPGSGDPPHLRAGDRQDRRSRDAQSSLDLTRHRPPEQHGHRRARQAPVHPRGPRVHLRGDRARTPPGNRRQRHAHRHRPRHEERRGKQRDPTRGDQRVGERHVLCRIQL